MSTLTCHLCLDPIDHNPGCPDHLTCADCLPWVACWECQTLADQTARDHADDMAYELARDTAMED